MYAKSQRFFPEVGEVTAAELLERQAAGEKIVVVDVRSPLEQAVSMIDGAVTQVEFEQALADHMDATIVAYCTIGQRSGLYAQALAARGLNALNLKGAILSWTHVGGALADESGPTLRVHVSGPRYSLAAAGYEPTW